MLKKLKDKIVEHYLKKGECSCTGSSGACCEAKIESDGSLVKVIPADNCCKK